MAVFDDGTHFRANSDHTHPNTPGFVVFTFSVTHTPMDPATPRITELEIANAISAIAQAKGYTKPVFSGPQATAQLNP
ncbi:hypothetical protein ACH4E8_05770 [Streptomyces sp. NPDC017979]|uniref:hypothetical protein n=1 Tax=Streptomyces sp. NPDC017979 TaxID=3365024 RepID=UPI0037B79C85